MCFTEIIRYRCGHSDIDQKVCLAPENQENQGQPEKAPFWKRLFGYREKSSEPQCTIFKINRYIDDYCGPCLRAAERQRRNIMAKIKAPKQSSKGKVTGNRQEVSGETALNTELDKDRLLFRCSRCKLEKRYPLAAQRNAHSGLCCANGISEFGQFSSNAGESVPASEYVRATSATGGTSDKGATKDSRSNKPLSGSISGENRRKDLRGQASISPYAVSPDISQIDNPSGIDFVRWNTTIRRTDHGSYPGPSSSPPDEPLPTRPLSIRKASTASGPEPGRIPSGSLEQRDVPPPIPSRHPSRAIRALDVPRPVPPQRGASSRTIFDSPGGMRRKPILKARGADAHYYPPPSPHPALPPTTNFSLPRSPAAPRTLRRSSQRIEDLQLSSGFSNPETWSSGSCCSSTASC